MLNPSNSSFTGITETCFYWLHNYDDVEIIRIELSQKVISWYRNLITDLMYSFL
jgi:hypothetical protein